MARLSLRLEPRSGSFFRTVAAAGLAAGFLGFVAQSQAESNQYMSGAISKAAPNGAREADRRRYTQGSPRAGVSLREIDRRGGELASVSPKRETDRVKTGFSHGSPGAGVSLREIDRRGGELVSVSPKRETDRVKTGLSQGSPGAGVSLREIDRRGGELASVSPKRQEDRFETGLPQGSPGAGVSLREIDRRGGELASVSPKREDDRVRNSFSPGSSRPRVSLPEIDRRGVELASVPRKREQDRVKTGFSPGNPEVGVPNMVDGSRDEVTFVRPQPEVALASGIEQQSIRPEAKQASLKSIDVGPFVFGPTQNNPPAETYGTIVAQYAASLRVPESLVHAVIQAESNYRPNARGSAGEIGLMQIKLETARLMGYSGSAQGLFEPETNIRFGIKYLATAYRLSGADTCLTVLRYNAGHGAKRMNPVSAAYCSKVKQALSSGSESAPGLPRLTAQSFFETDWSAYLIAAIRWL